MGILIVLDGLDGSGKSTQAALLRERLEKTYGKTRLISYPDYEKPSVITIIDGFSLVYDKNFRLF